jgi:hypothetical protein
MIVVRFKVECQPEKAEQVREALEQVIAPSRALAGVISFDIGRDLADPSAFVATEVFEDRAALDLGLLDLSSCAEGSHEDEGGSYDWLCDRARRRRSRAGGRSLSHAARTPPARHHWVRRHRLDRPERGRPSHQRAHGG